MPSWTNSGSDIYYTGGNVGIGTTTPLRALEVEGEIQIDNGAYGRLMYSQGNTNIWSVGPRDSTDYYIYRESGSGNVLIPNGNVGIGTASPSDFVSMQKNQDGFTVASLTNTNNTSAARTAFIANAGSAFGFVETLAPGHAGLAGWTGGSTIFGASGGDVFAGPFDSHGFHVQTGGVGTKRLTVDPNGKVGVGTPAPAELLQVGNYDTNYAMFAFNHNGTQPQADFGLKLGYNFTGGRGEANFWNAYPSAVRSFQFSQKTGASSYTDVMTIDANGDVSLGGVGGVGCVMRDTAWGSVFGHRDQSDKQAIDAIIAGATEIEFFPGTYLIDADTTWPADRAYRFHAGAHIQVSAGKVLTILGKVEAGLYKIFGGGSATWMDLAGTVQGLKSVLPDWWYTDPSGAHDSWAGIQSALNAAADLSTVYVPPGKYLCSAQLFVSNKSITVMGAGLATRVIFNNAASNGFKFYLRLNNGSGEVDSPDRLTFAGFDIGMSGGQSGGAGLWIEYDQFGSSSGIGTQRVNVRDVQIRPFDFGGHFAFGALFLKVQNFSISGLAINDWPVVRDASGVVTNGYPDGWGLRLKNCVGATINALQINGGDGGAWFEGAFPLGPTQTGGLEGVYLSDFYIYNCGKTALYISNATGVGVCNGHLLAVTEWTIKADAIVQSSFDNLLCYKLGNAGPTSAAIEFFPNGGQVSHCSFSGITMYNNAAGTATVPTGGFYLHGAGRDNRIVGCTVVGGTTAYSLGTGTANCLVTNNIADGCSATFGNLGSGNLVNNNLP